MKNLTFLVGFGVIFSQLHLAYFFEEYQIFFQKSFDC